MARDWMWGWIGVLPGILIGFLVTDYIGLFGKTSVWAAIAMSLGLTAVFATGILWIVNRRSIRKARLAGRRVQLIVRPFHAVMEAAYICLAMFGAFALAKLVFLGQFSDWQGSLIVSAAWGYIMALAKTAYTSPD